MRKGSLAGADSVRGSSWCVCHGGWWERGGGGGEGRESVHLNPSLSKI